MVEAKAIGIIKDNGIITGYTLRDTDGNEMNIICDAIIGAMKSGKINISNLTITKDNKLVMIDKSEKNSANSEKEQVKMENKPVKMEANVENKSSSNSDIDRIHELVKILNKARFAYEQQDEEIMSNFEYDKLYDELKELEEKTGTVLNNSPTANVGYEVVGKLPKKKHETPMLSLDKTKETSALKAFLNSRKGVLSWKLDGLTVVLTYMGGVLIEAVTRGNGEIGEVVTANARTFVNLPRKIKYKGKLVLRGEATISYDDFERINSSLPAGEDPYKNPRNLCSGSVRQQDSSITAGRNVNWTCFNVEYCDENMPNEVDKQLDAMKILGFDTVDFVIVDANTIENAISNFESQIKTGQMRRPSDGLVLTYQDRAYGKSLGRTTKFPRHSIAFKWEDEQVETTLRDIEWSVGKSGVITPVAIYDPVDIEGSTVSRASLHNLSVMIDILGQPYVGQHIKVYKSNMIIPQISWGEKLEDL